MPSHSIDEPSTDTTHALIEAARKGSIEEVLAALPSARINGTNASGETALLAAATACRRDVARLLVELHASVTARWRGHDSLCYFAKAGWTDLISICLDRSANRPHGGPDYIRAFSLAATYGHTEVLTLIGSRLAWDEETKKAQLALALYAAESPAVVDTLMALGADPNARIANGETPIFGTARNDHADACRQLIAHGADVNLRANGKTPLYYAALHNCPAVMMVLLAAGAMHDSIDDKGRGLVEVLSLGGREVTAAYGAWRARTAMRTTARSTKALGAHDGT